MDPLPYPHQTTIPTGNDSLLQLAVNGSPLTGLTIIPLYRPTATDCGPKWGLYRGTTHDMHDDWVEHKDITARKIE